MKWSGGWLLTATIIAISLAISYVLFQLGIYFFFLPIYCNTNTQTDKLPYDNNIRKWIHRFNSHAIDGIVSRKHNHTAPKITDDIEKEIVQIASQ